MWDQQLLEGRLSFQATRKYSAIISLIGIITVETVWGLDVGSAVVGGAVIIPGYKKIECNNQFDRYNHFRDCLGSRCGISSSWRGGYHSRLQENIITDI